MKKIMKKYNGTFLKMNEMSGLNDDISVCLDKLKYMNDKHYGREVAGNDEYPVPVDFDYEQFEADLKAAETEKAAEKEN